MSAQSIISLGIDVSGFSAEKQAILNSFISIFDRLEKYDGKVFNINFGGGLIEFNNSIATTSKLLDEINIKMMEMSKIDKTASASTDILSNEIKKLTGTISLQAKEIAALKLNLSDLSKEMIRVQNGVDDTGKRMRKNSDETKNLISDYQILRRTLQEQAAAYQQAYIASGRNKEAPQVKTALAEYAATSSIVADIDGHLSKADASANKFGGSLRSAFGSLRTIAYILPGIGLAGIFNLAFEAIQKVFEELSNAQASLKNLVDEEVKFNDVLKDQVDIQKELISQRDRLIQLAISESAYKQQTGVDISQAIGKDKITIGDQKVAVAATEYQDARSKLPPGTDANTVFSKINETITKEKELSDHLKTLEVLAASRDEKGFKEYTNAISDLIISTPDGTAAAQIKLRSKKVNGGYVFASQEELDALVKQYKSELELAKKDASDKLTVYQTYFDKEKQLHVATQEQVKAIDDENRKNQVENSKQNLETIIKDNEIILKAEISSEQDRLNALDEIRKAKKNIALQDYNNVAGNNSSTPQEKGTSSNKLVNSNSQIDSEFYQKRLDLIESYRQRLLKANTQIEKDSVDTVAIANERIFKNETQSLDKRLEAYAKYIEFKQKLQDLEYAKDIDTLSLKAKGPVPQKELKALNSARLTQKANIQADAEKQVYDIVYTSLQSQLKAVLDENKLEDNDGKSKEADEIRRSTTLYHEKKLTYLKYVDEIKSIEKEFGGETIAQDIKNDEDDIKRLEKHLDDLKEQKIKSDQEVQEATVRKGYKGKTADGKLASEEEYNVAVGGNKAINDAIVKAEEELNKKKAKLRDDDLKDAKNKIEEEKRLNKEIAENKKKIIDQLYKLIKAAVDAEYQHREEQVEREKTTYDESANSEIEAIQKSSLTAKDKAALDIQLGEQKKEYDKAAALEERRLKHDNAIIDRNLNVAHILWNTEESVSAALKLPPPAGEILAAQRALLGGLEVATVLATAVPSYKEGTDYHPGGLARFGEDGAEIINEPGKDPYLSIRETIKFLPEGTSVIPISDHPDFSKKETKDESWAQTKYLARQIKGIANSGNRSSTIVIDMGYQTFKKKILGK